MDFTIENQMREFFLSCGMGFILGIYYDIFRVYRLVMRTGKRTLFFQDVVFFLTAAVITFLFSLAVMDGRLRFYLFLGEAVGFFAYYFTLGRVVVRLSVIAVNALRFIIINILNAVSVPFGFLIGVLCININKILEIIKKIVKKAVLILKKGLKHTRLVLYNQKKVS